MEFKDSCNNISLNGIKVKQKEYKQRGKFPVVDQDQELIGGYFDNEELVVKGLPPFIVFGDHTKVKKYLNFKFIDRADGVKVLKAHNFFNPTAFYTKHKNTTIPDRHSCQGWLIV